MSKTTIFGLPLIPLFSAWIMTSSLFGFSMPEMSWGKDSKECLIDRSLKMNAMRKGDLSIRSDLSTNPFALSYFRRWMINPADAPLKAQEIAVNLLGRASRPCSWIRNLASLGDLPSQRGLSVSKDPWPGISAPFKVKAAINRLLNAIQTANTNLAAIMKQLSPENVTLFQKHLHPVPCFGRTSEKVMNALIEMNELGQAIEALNGYNRADLLKAGLTVIAAMEEAEHLLLEAGSEKETVTSFSFETEIGLVEIGGKGPDVHEKSAALIIDLGGDDIYRGKTAFGTNGRCSLVIDLGGDDVYLAHNCAQGSGILGIGILHDLGGNDLYSAGGCSQGVGLFGMGLLMDDKGEDSYLATEFVQAASLCGLGGLIDMDGNDTYRCRHSGQAYAGVLGVSCLCDTKGNDKYLSGTQTPDPREPDMNVSFSQGYASGIRNLAAGGFALLADKSGNDLYQCQYFGQGASYWMGIGVLYDEAGKDTYVARRYAQGAGIHYSLGMLLDAAGNDHTSSWGVSQGCGHDYGIGILVNEKGDDTYVSDWLSLGASNASGVGVFVDNSGNDGYESRQGMGVGKLTRRRGGIGLFVDAGGTDRYSRLGADNTLWGKNRWGIGIDEDAKGPSGMNLIASEKVLNISVEAEKKREEEKRDLLERLALAEQAAYPENIEWMLSVASHWGLEKEVPKEAGNRILGLPPEKSSPVISDFIHTPNIMSLIFMKKFFTVHAFHAMHGLVKKAQSSNPLDRARACYYLGLLKDSRTLQCLTGALKDPSWRIRSSAAHAIGEILNKKRLFVLKPMKDAFDKVVGTHDPSIIMNYLKDKERIASLLSVMTRAIPLPYQTYRRYGEIGSHAVRPDALTGLIDLAFQNADRILPVLRTWITDIKESSKTAEELTRHLADLDPAVRKAAAYSLGQMHYGPAIRELIALLEDPDLWVRNAVVLSLALFGNTSVSPLERTMARKGPSFKIMAMDVLARIKTDHAKDVIKNHLDDSDKGVMIAAQRALSCF